MLNDFTAWLQKPFSVDGDAMQWVLFVGLILIGIWFWHRTIAAFTNT
jgi:hypothetical protein